MNPERVQHAFQLIQWQLAKFQAGTQSSAETLLKVHEAILYATGPAEGGWLDLDEHDADPRHLDVRAWVEEDTP